MTHFEGHYGDMEKKLKRIETLDALRDRVYGVVENGVHLRASLSKEGLEV